MGKNLQLATFGGGCFWCVEAVFEQLRGVEKVVSGYAGGLLASSGQAPTYAEVSTGKTGHTEAVQVMFDPVVVSYEQLLAVFFYTHDPTTMNRQGADVGTQYRSAIFYHDDSQKQAAEKIIAELTADHTYGAAKIVTQVLPFNNFYPATAEHQDYYANNSSAPYCQLVINPKLDKLREKFAPLLK